MLEVRNISTGYRGKQILYNVSFNVKSDKIVLITGNNGAGKSTIVKCIYGLLDLWSGEIFFNGENISGARTHDLIKKGIVYIPQKNNYFENLTIQENLEISGSIYSKTEINKKIDYIFKIFPKFAQYKKRSPFNLSGGERQLLAFCMAIIHQPKLIIIDEPLAGIDIENSKIIIDKISQLNIDKKVGFLIIEHKIRFPENFISEKYDIELGKIKKIGN